jgi:tripartite-type tricarboxylate transporter receptor subunit TctC
MGGRLWRAATLRCAVIAAVLFSTSVQFASKLNAAVVEGTVRLIVNFPAGSGTADTIARMMSNWLAHKWLQPVLVENQPGMTGNLGAESVFAAAPDGRTLLVTPPGPLTVAPLMRTVAFDPRQFAPVTILVTTPTVLVARPNLPPKIWLNSSTTHHPSGANQGCQSRHGLDLASHGRMAARGRQYRYRPRAISRIGRGAARIGRRARGSDAGQPW